MKYLYIIYKGYIPEILCEEYTGGCGIQNKNNPPPQDNKIRYHFYSNPPPPDYIFIGAIIKIVRVSWEPVVF
jgi:hypothetical protein